MVSSNGVDFAGDKRIKECNSVSFSLYGRVALNSGAEPFEIFIMKIEIMRTSLSSDSFIRNFGIVEEI